MSASAPWGKEQVKAKPTMAGSLLPDRVDVSKVVPVEVAVAAEALPVGGVQVRDEVTRGGEAGAQRGPLGYIHHLDRVTGGSGFIRGLKTERKTFFG